MPDLLGMWTGTGMFQHLDSQAMAQALGQGLDAAQSQEGDELEGLIANLQQQMKPQQREGRMVGRVDFGAEHDFARRNALRERLQGLIGRDPNRELRVKVGDVEFMGDPQSGEPAPISRKMVYDFRAPGTKTKQGELLYKDLTESQMEQLRQQGLLRPDMGELVVRSVAPQVSAEQLAEAKKLIAERRQQEAQAVSPELESRLRSTASDSPLKGLQAALERVTMDQQGIEKTAEDDRIAKVSAQLMAALEKREARKFRAEQSQLAREAKAEQTRAVAEARAAAEQEKAKAKATAETAKQAEGFTSIFAKATKDVEASPEKRNAIIAQLRVQYGALSKEAKAALPPEVRNTVERLLAPPPKSPDFANTRPGGVGRIADVETANLAARSGSARSKLADAALRNSGQSIQDFATQFYSAAQQEGGGVGYLDELQSSLERGYTGQPRSALSLLGNTNLKRSQKALAAVAERYTNDPAEQQEIMLGLVDLLVTSGLFGGRK